MKMDRRDFVSLSGAATIAALAPAGGAPTPGKRVIVAGGGIGGLSTAYELMKRGHDVTVLEASQQPGGHVRTMSDPLDDGLYADLGAEQCTKPGYEIYRAYAKEFGLELMPYPRRINQLSYLGNKPYTDEMLHDKKVLQGFGYNAREAAYMAEHGWKELGNLFFAPYLDAFEDEYQPFGIGLDELDQISERELVKREKASGRALRDFGGGVSALQSLWNAAILKQRKVPLYPKNVFRIKGGNQRLTDAFAERLGKRVRLNSPVSLIEHNDTGVNIHYTQDGREQSMAADYLVNAIPLMVLLRVKFEPALSAEKTWVMQNTAYDFQSRVVFQARRPFWKDEGHSANILCRRRHLHMVWEMAEEVQSDRAILLGVASAGTTAEQAMAVYRDRYPGKAMDIENTIVHTWVQDKWSPVCERQVFGLNRLKRFWPEIIRPHGRIHFAGAYADNLSWGQEAATRSAHRVAKEIDAAG
jgi:monoamine oxidase